MKTMLCKQNSAAMFLTHVSPASLLDGSGLLQMNQDWVEIV
jgi:hypothetical protein